MVALYVTSLERGTGKTAVCAGIGDHLLADGRKAGYFKPTIIENVEAPDSDTTFIKHIFNLEEPIESLCPFISDESNLSGRIKEAYARASSGKDVVIVESIYEPRIAEALQTKTVLVEGYAGELSEVKINRYKALGANLLGVVLNKVPKSKMGHVSSETSAQLDKAGVNVLGVLPEDRILCTLTIGELAQYLQGEIMNNAEQSAELAENFMLGAMVVDSGLEYFGRKANKAAVVRSERSDMQLAALETSTRCLILSGDTTPLPAVLVRAEEKHIPIIVAHGDTDAIVTGIEDALDKAIFSQDKKLPKLTQIMAQHFNFPALYQGLGFSH